MLSILAFSSRVTKAFVHKNKAVGFGAARLLSIKGGANNMPSNEELKPFYALGINIANQIGGELKVSLTKEELQIVVDGFTDSMRDAVEDDRYHHHYHYQHHYHQYHHHYCLEHY